MFTGCYVVFVGSIGSGVSMSQMPSLSKAKASASKVFGILEEPTKINPKQTGYESVTHGRIEFKNVTFRYPSRKNYVLSHFNLTIEPNQSVAIVGHSGSGKSTIASLLLRFYNVKRGGIYIDGRDIKGFAMPYLRKKLTIVMQEPLLFNESIKENILMGDEFASDQNIHKVAVQTNSLPFILQSDDDFNSLVVR